jgi:2-polyprenyl-6-hydroxyphenyl methylase/3-demethylubiquinone-9 3-methyltransferase
MTAPASPHPGTAHSSAESLSGGAAPFAHARADAAEVGKFDALSHRFWDAQGEFKPLHILNPVRAKFVADRVKLSGASVLDVGCGGGLLCEALLHAGVTVTGVDLAQGMVEVAHLHAAEQGLSIDYRIADAESLLATHAGRFDVVTCMEMLEHVPNPAGTLATLAKLARPGGSVFVSTLNRNLRSFLLAIVGAEYVMKLIPPGTHEYERLIKPAELAAWGRAAGLELRDVAGLDFNPFSERCALTRDPSINYLVHLERG